jgi:hypothetical protein
VIWARWASAAVLVVLLTTGIGFGVHYLKELGRNELRPKVAELESLLAAEKNARERAETAANAYWTELGNLSRRPVSAAPVRLCVGPMPSLESTTTSSDGATSRAGSDDRPAGGDLEAGPDIGPELYGLAKTCDAEIAKLRALQGWINDVR